MAIDSRSGSSFQIAAIICLLSKINNGLTVIMPTCFATEARKANSILSCVNRGAAAGHGRGCSSLLCSCVPHLQYCMRAWTPAQEGCGGIGAGQRKAMKMHRGVEYLCYEERWRELDLFSLEKRRWREDLTATFQYLRGA